jgi:HPt (histidine-containing phosphotransfer) domain-containing protein
MREPGRDPRCPVDLDAALEYAGGEPDLLEKVFEVFLGEARGQLASVRAAFSRGRATEVMNGAHALKGSLQLVGAAETAKRAERLELAGRASRLEGLESEVASFETEMARLLEWIEARLARPGGVLNHEG